MEKNVSRKNSEFLMNFYLMNNKHILEEMIGEEMEEVLLEKNFFGQKIDMYSQLSKCKREVFFECTTGTSTQRHISFFRGLLYNIDTPSCIVYIAQSFVEKHLQSIIACIKSSKKPISFYAIEASEELISEIEGLCGCHSMLVYDRIAQIIIESPLDLVENIDFASAKNAKETAYDENERTIIEKRNATMINGLRKQIPQFMNCWREKKVISNRILHYSAGRSDVTYFLCAGDRHERAFVSLGFGAQASHIYYKIREDEVKYRQRIDESIDFNDEIKAITVNIPPVHVYRRIDMVVEIFSKFVKHFSTEICYWGCDEYEEMKQQMSYK